MCLPSPPPSNYWGRATHKCVSKLAIIGSENGLPPARRQASFWTNAEILLIWHLVIHFNEIVRAIYTFSFKNMHFKIPFTKWRPFCLSLNVLIVCKKEKCQNVWWRYDKCGYRIVWRSREWRGTVGWVLRGRMKGGRVEWKDRRAGS